jgi:hypothetical protein
LVTLVFIDVILLSALVTCKMLFRKEWKYSSKVFQRIRETKRIRCHAGNLHGLNGKRIAMKKTAQQFRILPIFPICQ